jgi:hypothetical protein
MHERSGFEKTRNKATKNARRRDEENIGVGISGIDHKVMIG